MLIFAGGGVFPMEALAWDLTAYWATLPEFPTFERLSHSLDGLDDVTAEAA